MVRTPAIIALVALGGLLLYLQRDFMPGVVAAIVAAVPTLVVRLFDLATRSTAAASR
jgi:hypothetical protein